MADEQRHISELTPDPDNPRKHGPRNIGLIVDSLQRVGAFRSIGIDQDNVVRVGNGTIEAAAEAGITKVRIVDADGDELIAVRRHLTPQQKLEAALYDNRASDTAEGYDREVIRKLQTDRRVELDRFFTPKELDRVLDRREPVYDADGDDADAITQRRRLVFVFAKKKEWEAVCQIFGLDTKTGHELQGRDLLARLKGDHSEHKRTGTGTETKVTHRTVSGETDRAGKIRSRSAEGAVRTATTARRDERDCVEASEPQAGKGRGEARRTRHTAPVEGTAKGSTATGD